MLIDRLKNKLENDDWEQGFLSLSLALFYTRMHVHISNRSDWDKKKRRRMKTNSADG